MVRLLADENLKNAVLRGARLLRPFLDVVRVQDVGLSGEDDPFILGWAANEGRILLTHDAATVPFYAYERMRAGQRMSGVCIVSRGVPVGRVIDDILVIAECSDESDWQGVVRYLPL